MRRIISLILWIVIIGALAHVLATLESTTQIDWLGWRLTAPTSLLVAAAFIIIWLVLILDRALSFLAGIPRALTRGFSRRHQRLGQRALALGMVAVAAGEGRAALKYARKSVHHLGHDVLTDLLMAQATSLSGDREAAKRYFDALKKNADTAHFGHIGNMRLALEAGDEDTALLAGRAAMKLKPRTPSIADALFVLEAKHGAWDEAEIAFRIARQGDSDISAPHTHAHAEASILLERARQTTAPRRKQKFLTRAIQADANFLPAILEQAEFFLAEQKTRKATALMERGFISTPHPRLAEKLMAHWSGTPAKKLARLIKLTEQGGNQKEALFASARVALEQGLWGEATRLAELIPMEARDTRIWQLLAELAEQQPGKTDANSTMILRQNFNAPRAPNWLCASCQQVSDDYHAICPHCGTFAQIDWK